MSTEATYREYAPYSGDFQPVENRSSALTDKDEEVSRLYKNTTRSTDQPRNDLGGAQQTRTIVPNNSSELFVDVISEYGSLPSESMNRNASRSKNEASPEPTTPLQSDNLKKREGAKLQNQSETSHSRSRIPYESRAQMSPETATPLQNVHHKKTETLHPADNQEYIGKVMSILNEMFSRYEHGKAVNKRTLEKDLAYLKELDRIESTWMPQENRQPLMWELARSDVEAEMGKRYPGAFK